MDGNTTDTRFFNVTVLRPALGGDPVVEYVEVVTAASRYRVFPKKIKSLEGVLDVRLAEFLKLKLEHVEKATMLFHDPDACFSMPSLTLSNLQIIATRTSEGLRKTVFRFSQVAGRVQSVMRSSVEGLRSSIQDIAVGAFEDVFRDGLALAQATHVALPEDAYSARFGAGQRRLDSQIDTLMFRLNMMQTHLTNLKQSRDAGILAVQPDQHQLPKSHVLE